MFNLACFMKYPVLNIIREYVGDSTLALIYIIKNKKRNNAPLFVWIELNRHSNFKKWKLTFHIIVLSAVCFKI